MGWNLIQSKISTAESANTKTTSFSSQPHASALMIATVETSNASTTPVVSDSNGNWILLNQWIDPTPMGLWHFGKIATVSQPTSITATASGSNISLNVYEYDPGAGIWHDTLPGLVDVSSTSSGPSGTSSSGFQPGITTQASAVLVHTTLGVTNSITSPTLSDGTFTLAGSGPSGAIRLVDYYKANASVGTYNPSYSWTTSRPWAQLITAFEPPPSITYLDDFNRASLGTLAANGATYFNADGWSIDASTTLRSVNAGVSSLAADFGSADVVVSMDYVDTISNDQGIAARWQDASNFIGIQWQAGTLYLEKLVSGGFTTLFSVSVPSAPTNLTVVMRGANYRIYCDGVLQLDATDGTLTFATQTKHGMFMNSLNKRFDNFSVTVPAGASAYPSHPNASTVHTLDHPQFIFYPPTMSVIHTLSHPQPVVVPTNVSIAGTTSVVTGASVLILGTGAEFFGSASIVISDHGVLNQGPNFIANFGADHPDYATIIRLNGNGLLTARVPVIAVDGEMIRRVSPIMPTPNRTTKGRPRDGL